MVLRKIFFKKAGVLMDRYNEIPEEVRDKN